MDAVRAENVGVVVIGQLAREWGWTWTPARLLTVSLSGDSRQLEPSKLFRFHFNISAFSCFLAGNINLELGARQLVLRRIWNSFLEHHFYETHFLTYHLVASTLLLSFFPILFSSNLMGLYRFTVYKC